MEKDFYKILGISKGATKDEIKRAYLEKAKKYHPDKGGDEQKFKEINEAYQVLSDDQKRSHYDQFGSAGPQNFGGGGFSGFGGGGFQGFSSADFGGFEDIFSSFFGGGTDSFSARGKRSRRGSDLEVSLDISFEESLNGIMKKIPSKIFVACDKCSGEGGKGKKTCSSCKGTGRSSQRIQTPFGTISQQTVCSACSGEGSTFEKTCEFCHGQGRVEKKIDIEVNIPAGISDGTILQISGKGEAGIRGEANGDLFVHISVRESREFVRKGMDIYSELKIPLFDALLGGDFEVKTFWGKMNFKLPENTKEGSLFRIKGKGVRRDSQQGDHIVEVRYEMPKKISGKLRDLLEQAKKI